MKFCTNCGHEIHDEAIVCVHCGTAVKTAPANKPVDAPNGGFTVLGIFVPQAALILYIIFKCKGMPLRAHSAGKGALIGGIISAACLTFYYVFYFLYILLIMLSAM